MRYILILSLFSFLSFVACDSVLDFSSLSPDAFKDELANHELILVEFFAPWCGHCQKLAPEYEKASEVLSKEDPPVPLAKVDCTNESGGKEICSQNDVSGFPTLKIFVKGTAQEYDGGRSSKDIIKKMRSLAGPVSQEVSSFEKIQSLYKDGNTPLVIGIFKNAQDSLYKQYSDAAAANRDVAKYLHIFADSASDKIEKFTSLESKTSIPAIVLARQIHQRSKLEPDHVIYKDGDLKAWIADSVYGLVIPRDLMSSRLIKAPYITVYYNVDYERDPKGTNYWRNRVLKVATKNVDSTVKFTISDIQEFSRHLGEFGLDAASYTKDSAPFVTAVDGDGNKFAMKDKFSVDTFSKFVEAFLDSSLEPFLKSEDEPEDNDSADVKVAVGKNFKKLVEESDKDVFIKFYAPWCGHCKSLAPTWDELGAKLKDEPGVVIAKLDATANDVPDKFMVQGYPTLYWFPKDTKTPSKYEGGRSIDDLLSYIAKHASSELKGYDRTGAKKDVKEDL